MSRYAQTLVLSVKYDKTTTAIDETSLQLTTAAAAALLRSPGAFRQRCGTAFIKRQVFGGTFVAMYSATANEQGLKTDFAAKVAASVPSGSGTAKLKQTLEALSQFATVNVHWESLGGIEDPKSQGPNDLQAYADTFRDVVDRNPKPAALRVAAASYRGIGVTNCGDAKAQEQCEQNLSDFLANVSTSEKLFARLNADQARALALRDTLQDALEFSGNYWGASPAVVKAALQTTHERIEAISDMALTCGEPAEPCVPPSTPALPKISLIVANWVTVNPKSMAMQDIGDVATGDTAVLNVVGGWIKGANLPCLSNGDGLMLRVTPLDGRAATTVGNLASIGGPARVQIQAIDATWGPGYTDNDHCDHTYPLRAALVPRPRP